MRKDLDEEKLGRVESIQNLLRHDGTGLLVELLQDVLEKFDVFRKVDRQEVDGVLVAPSGEVSVDVENVSDSAGHSGREVSSGRTENDDSSAGHVFAAVIADAFDDGRRSGVSDAKSFGDESADESEAGSRAVQNDVSGDDVFFGGEGRLFWRIDDDSSAGQSFAEIVVRVALEGQRDAVDL